VSIGPEDRERLERYLLDQGADPEELREAAENGTLNPLALELALRPRGERVPFAEAITRAGLDPDQAAALWRALGFPDPLRFPPTVTESQIDSLRVFAEMLRMLGEETTIQLARTIGGAVELLAEAIVDAFRLHVEMPRRNAGEPESQVVEDYARTASVAIPALGQTITDALGAHMVVVARSTWALDAERAAVTRERTVGFADLVGYTSSVRRVSPAVLAATIGSFEGHVAEVVTSFGGRVVKLIGDEAMFVLGDPGAACELALALQRRLAEDPQLPPVRIALAAGPVVSHRGDYYGDTVNLAARLVKVAEPGEVLVSESLTGAAGLGFEPIEVPPLKGYVERLAAYRLSMP
jgi:adenylate cyclase